MVKFLVLGAVIFWIIMGGITFVELTREIMEESGGLTLKHFLISFLVFPLCLMLWPIAIDEAFWDKKIITLEKQKDKEY